MGIVAAYIMKHKPTGYYYVGSTTDYMTRMRNHRHKFNNASHENKRLQSIFTCWEDFDVEVFKLGTIKEAKAMEQRLLDQHRGKGLCCNFASSSTDPTAGVITNERRREVNLGNTNMLGKKHTEETRAKIGTSATGRTKSDEVRRKISLAKSMAVIAGGVQYESVLAASTALGISGSTIRSRIISNSAKFKDWKFVDPKSFQ